jgi:hypothetical protein
MTLHIPGFILLYIYIVYILFCFFRLKILLYQFFKFYAMPKILLRRNVVKL